MGEHEHRHENERLDQLSSYGFVGNKEFLMCHYVKNQKNKGIFWGENPFHHISSVLMAQIILIFIVGRITHLLLRPCRQTLIIAQIMAGIIIGPSFLSQECFEKVFPKASRLTLSTFAEFGMVIHFFKIGVQVNAKNILTIQKHAMVTGIVGYTLAIALGNAVFKFVERISPIGSEDETAGVPQLVIFGGLTSFAVISGFLNEMNILNSEIGRLALSTSMVSDACAWFVYLVVLNITRAIDELSYGPMMQMLMSMIYFAVMFFLLRPLVIWISNRNPKGKPMKESHFLSIICILLFVGFFAQVVGQPAFFGAFIFGLALPDGPPLGSVLAERLDTVGSNLIVPAYCTISGLKAGVPSLAGSKTTSIQIIIVSGYIGKFVGTILPSLYFQIQFWDSFALALIMCCKGIVDLCLYNIVLDNKEMGELPFTLLLYTMVAVTGFVTIVVYYIYDPSRKYKAYIRRSIVDYKHEDDLRMLVCVHTEENVYPIINLLESSSPTKATPLSVFVLHLLELSGRAASILTKIESTNKSSFRGTSSERIRNVFDQFELHNKGCVRLHTFTAVAPYASMHDDICYMAMDTKCNIVIMPFHKLWTINANAEVSNPLIRTLNQNVLKNSPCSVGVLIDRSQLRGNLSVFYEKTICEVAMMFLGGADDQEALAYSLRLAQHPNIRLTVYWIRAEMQGKHRNVKNPYVDLMEEIRYSSKHKGRVEFMEECVNDGEGTAQIIRKMEGNFHLVLAGRQHLVDSPCILGLTEWCEYPELGPIGSILATSDFTFSALVVQQEHFNSEFRYITR